MSLEYAESSSASAFITTAEPTSGPRGVSLMGFSYDGNLLSTVDQARPNIVWIWNLENAPVLVSALVHEHAVRQVIWHPLSMQLLITTANNALPTVRYWCPHQPPCIVRIPVSRSESGRYDVRWLPADKDEFTRLWFGSPDDYVLGLIESDEHGAAEFRCFNTLGGKVSPGSQGTIMSR